MASVKKIVGGTLAGIFGTAALGLTTLFMIPDPMDDAREARNYGGMSQKKDQKPDNSGIAALMGLGLAGWLGKKVLDAGTPPKRKRATPAPRKP
jgi:hypothetical protein